MNIRTALVLAAATLATTGCLSIQTVDVRDALKRSEFVPVEGVEKLDRELTVYVVSTEAMGGVIVETLDPTKVAAFGSYTTELFPLDGEDPDAQIEAAAENARGLLGGLRVEGFAEVLTELLRRRLKERFETVTVKTVRSLDAASGVTVRPKAESYMEVIPGIDKHSMVRLEADAGERKIFVKGHGVEHINRAHLVWAVPATFVSATTIGLPGLVAIHFGLNSLEFNALEDSLVEGIDRAAKKLAERLAEEPDRPVPLDLGGVSP